jgi:adenine deaminase
LQLFFSAHPAQARPNDSDDDMTSFDLVIAGGRVVSADSVFEADIAVSGETIVAIGGGLAARGAREVIPAAGRYVLPGAIDSHVHFREPATPIRRIGDPARRRRRSAG